MPSKDCKSCGKRFDKKIFVSCKDWLTTKFCSLKCYWLAKRGVATWNKGRKGLLSANSGSFAKGLTPWNKNLRGYRAGALNNKWKGGITLLQHKLRRTPEYKNWRKAVLRRDKLTCQSCGKSGVRLDVHHIRSFAEFPLLRTTLENGVALCVSCHRMTDSYGGSSSFIKGDENVSTLLGSNT